MTVLKWQNHLNSPLSLSLSLTFCLSICLSINRNWLRWKLFVSSPWFSDPFLEREGGGHFRFLKLVNVVSSSDSRPFFRAAISAFHCGVYVQIMDRCTSLSPSKGGVHQWRPQRFFLPPLFLVHILNWFVSLNPHLSFFFVYISLPPPLEGGRHIWKPPGSN